MEERKDMRDVKGVFVEREKRNNVQDEDFEGMFIESH